MEKNVSKHGTDARFPVWMGGIIDPKFVNGISAIAILTNYSMVFIHMMIIRSGKFPYWDVDYIIFVGLAVLICALFALVIRHSNQFTQNFIRVYSSGIPFVAHLGAIYLGVFPNY